MLTLNRLLRSITLIVCLFLLNSLFAQENKADLIRSYTAHVEDANDGAELPFANVYVSASVGTLTNLDGNFTLMAAPSTVVKISYIGYETATVTAGKMPKVIKLKPLSHSLNEVVVLPKETIIKNVEKKLARDLSRKGSKKSIFFYRQLTLTRNNELAEAFIEAKNAVNLRQLTSLIGQHGRKTEVGLARALIADMNFHCPLELGPMTEGASYWHSLLRPFVISYDKAQSFHKAYDFSLETMYDTEGTKIYAVSFKPNKNNYQKAALSGTVYVDSRDFSLLSYDGKVEGLTLDVTKDFIRMHSPIDLDIHIKYRHTNKYTEVENINYTIHSGDLTSHALLLNVDGMDVNSIGNKKKKARIRNNMLTNIDSKDFNEILAKNADFVQRTDKELELKEADEVSNPLVTLYNVKGKSTPTKWSVSLPDNKLGNLTNRLAKLGQVIPQEKVYLHMDNTSYFMGDTIWFSAYLRRTSDDMLSNISGVLYVELLNQDGYVMERKMIDTKNGYGHGSFALNRDWYSGYYELRAYTRWQLNWGVFERNHSNESAQWFINKEMEHKYFRDYEKLYSRVFPVYDATKKPGAFNEIMTLRELRAAYRTEPDKPKLQLSLYPEGGELIEGIPCRVAFEATYTDGKIVEGELKVDKTKNMPLITAKTLSRGRGMFVYTPTKNSDRDVTFVTVGGDKIKAKLPKAEKEGAAIQVLRNDTTWTFRVQTSGAILPDSIGLTIMHEGRLRHFFELTDSISTITVKESELECGVNQATVFDNQGRILADRLFFVNNMDMSAPSLTIDGVKEEYKPYEKISLTVSMNEDAARATSKDLDRTTGTISLAVRDRETSNHLFDNASMLTEMLLSSEIQGFVPSPQWFFQSNDASRREALDLLMMTQGWRRFNWRKMAVRGEWDLTQPDERTPIVTGNIYTYAPQYFYHPKDVRPKGVETVDDKGLNGWLEMGKKYHDDPNTQFIDSILATSSTPMNMALEIPNSLWHALEMERLTNKRLSKNVRVHAELVTTGDSIPLTVDVNSKNGQFRLTLPRFYDNSIFFLAASDTTKWRHGKSYEWVQAMPDEAFSRKQRVADGEFSVRIDHPYPRFVKPYSFYQQNLNYTDEKLQGARTLEDGTLQLQEVRVKARHSGVRSVNDTLPAFIVDAYEAYNYALDAGMLGSFPQHIARAYVGDYGLDRPYVTIYNDYYHISEKDYRLRVLKGANGLRRSLMDKTNDAEESNRRGNLALDRSLGDFISDFDEDTYGNLRSIEKYVIYTDFQPRRIDSSTLYYGSRLPRTYIAPYPYADYSQRMFYRDRRYELQGFAWPDEFYSPDYSNAELPEVPTDYRRTIYWNPDLKLNANGKASVTFWNNSFSSQLSISAEGVANNGAILSDK